MRAAAALLLLAAGAAHAQTGGEIYQDQCAACHDSGKNRAPRPSVVADWTERAKRGRPLLIRNALGTAPHAGGRTAEVTAAVDYMLSTVDILVNSYSEPPRLKSAK
ncbi:MAG TPA: c-type cytochrome [Burkholderiales bacterium]